MYAVRAASAARTAVTVFSVSRGAERNCGGALQHDGTRGFQNGTLAHIMSVVFSTRIGGTTSVTVVSRTLITLRSLLR